jgi:hypothetical protein
MYIYYFIDTEETTREEFSTCSDETREIAAFIRSNRQDFEPLEGSASLHFDTQGKSWYLDACDQEAFRHAIESVVCEHGALV